MPTCVLVLKIWQAGGRWQLGSQVHLQLPGFIKLSSSCGTDGLTKTKRLSGHMELDVLTELITKPVEKQPMNSLWLYSTTAFKVTKLLQVYSYYRTYLIAQLGIGLVQSFCMASHCTMELKLPFLTLSL